jgi:PCO_ADO
MNSSASGTAAPVKMNTRLEDLPDISDIRHPLVEKSVALIDRLRRRDIAVQHFQAAIAALHAELDLTVSLADWIQRALAEQQDQTLYRRTVQESRETIQLFYVAPGEVHPPHGHHNVISTQVVLHGGLHVREYDRVARLGPDTLLLTLQTDAWFTVGDAIRTTEISRNVHWFAAKAEPAVMLNFNIYGYQDWTLDPANRPFRRRLIDPTYGRTPDGWVIGKEVEVAAAYEKFGGKPIDSFPT